MSTVPKIYSAICRVIADLSKVGIAKDRDNKAQGFKFRGIDDVYNALAPLISANGITILPRVTKREVTERQSKNGGAIFYVTLEVDYDFVCAEDGSKHTVTMFGEAMDSADKATNKALSAAYKYACFQAFCIPTEGDNDADSGSPDVISRDEARRLERHHVAVDRYLESLETIRALIVKYDETQDPDALYTIAETWRSIPQEGMIDLWRAPSKGGWFTTYERTFLNTKLPPREGSANAAP